MFDVADFEIAHFSLAWFCIGTCEITYGVGFGVGDRLGMQGNPTFDIDAVRVTDVVSETSQACG